MRPPSPSLRTVSRIFMVCGAFLSKSSQSFASQSTAAGSWRSTKKKMASSLPGTNMLRMERTRSRLVSRGL